MEFVTAPGSSGSQWIGVCVTAKAANATQKSTLTRVNRNSRFYSGCPLLFP